MAAKEQHPKLNSGLHTLAQACVPARMYVCVLVMCVFAHIQRQRGGKVERRGKKL